MNKLDRIFSEIKSDLPDTARIDSLFNKCLNHKPIIPAYHSISVFSLAIMCIIGMFIGLEIYEQKYHQTLMAETETLPHTAIYTAASYFE